jgi:hypothetical protein
MDQAAFKRDFAKLEPLLLDEWPSVDKAALATASGDLEKVVALIAEATPHTKPVVRAKLAELAGVATREERPSQSSADKAGDLSKSLHDLLDRAEKRVTKLAAEATDSAVPAVRTFAKEHLLLTLLIVLGLGFLLGKAANPRGRRDC